MYFVVCSIALPHVIEMEIATFGKSIERGAVAVERSIGLHVGVGRVHSDLEVRALVVDGSHVGPGQVGVACDLRVGQARAVLAGLDTLAA